MLGTPNVMHTMVSAFSFLNPLLPDDCTYSLFFKIQIAMYAVMKVEKAPEKIANPLLVTPCSE